MEFPAVLREFLNIDHHWSRAFITADATAYTEVVLEKANGEKKLAYPITAVPENAVSWYQVDYLEATLVEKNDDEVVECRWSPWECLQAISRVTLLNGRHYSSS